MDNKGLDELLVQKFKSLQVPPEGPSIVPDVMSSVVQAADPLDGNTVDVDAALTESPNQDWVLVFAGLLGALVCLPAISGLEAEFILTALPLEWFGGYADFAASLALPLFFMLSLLPMGYLLLDD